MIRNERIKIEDEESPNSPLSGRDYGSSVGIHDDPRMMHLSQMRSVLMLKNSQIERLQAEIKTLIRIQRDQAESLRKALDDQKEFSKMIADIQKATIKMGNNPRNLSYSVEMSYGSSSTTSDSPANFLDGNVFLKLFLRNDDASLEEVLRVLINVTDENLRGYIGEQMLVQMKKFLEIQTVFVRVFEESNRTSFDHSFEVESQKIIVCKKVVFWNRLPQAKLIYSSVASISLEDGDGLVGFCAQEKEPITLSNPKKHEKYSQIDSTFLHSAEYVQLIPITNAQQEVIYIVEIIDTCDSSGNVSLPKPEVILIIEMLAAFIKAIATIQEDKQDSLSKILLDTQQSKLYGDHPYSIIEAIKNTAKKALACESVQFLFVDDENETFCEIQSPTKKILYSFNDCGIASRSYKLSQIISVPIAKEDLGFSITFDGEYPNGPVIAFPVMNSKKKITLLTVARQKRNSLIFSTNDEHLIEAFSKVVNSEYDNLMIEDSRNIELEKSKASHQHYTSLLSIAQSLSSTLDLNSLINKITVQAKKFLMADRCSVFLVNEAEGKLWSLVALGESERIYVNIGEGIAGSCVSTGETINIVDAYQDYRFNPNVDKITHYRTRSILCSPIRNQSRKVIGCIQMINKLGSNSFSETDIELLSAFNVFCGIAVSNAQLYEEAKLKCTRMSVLLSVSIGFTASKDLYSLSNHITEKSKEIVNCEKSLLFLFDEATNAFRCINQKITSEVSSKSDIVSFCALTRNQIQSSNPSKDNRFKLDYLNKIGLEVKNILSYPVFSRTNQVIGVLIAFNKIGSNFFTETDLDLFKGMSLLAGLSLERWLSVFPDALCTREKTLISLMTEKDMKTAAIPDKLKIFDPLLSTLISWDFSPISFALSDLNRFILHFFDHTGIITEYQIPIGVLIGMLDKSEAQSRFSPEFNWNHSVSMIHFVFLVMHHCNIFSFFSKIELFSILMVAINFYIGYGSQAFSTSEQKYRLLSRLYNNNDVDTSMRLSLLISLVSDSQILRSMSIPDSQEFWGLIRELYLMASKSKRNETIDSILAILRYRSTLDLSNKSHKILIMASLVASADLFSQSRICTVIKEEKQRKHCTKSFDDLIGMVKVLSACIPQFRSLPNWIL